MEPNGKESPRKVRLRQTQSYLRTLLGQHGVWPKNKLGQNFLIDLNVLELVVRSAELWSGDVVLEIGTGTGSLTQRLADETAAVLSVEVDPPIHAMATELIDSKGNVQLLLTDVLKNKNQLSPVVMEALASLLHQYPDRSLKVVANLPYAVATPVIANLLMTDLPIECFVVTVQWEMAERLMAKPGTKDFSALTVLVQSLADVELVRKLAPSVFWPRPMVHSAIVKIVPNAEKRSQIPDLERFRNFLRDVYVHRRKNLRISLSTMPSGRRSKTEIDEMLARLDIDGSLRAETLSVEQHLQLCEAYHQATT